MRIDIFFTIPDFDPGLRSIHNMGEARAWAQKKLGDIVLSVMDFKNPTVQEREMGPEGYRLPARLGDKFSYVCYVNNRPVE